MDSPKMLGQQTMIEPDASILDAELNNSKVFLNQKLDAPPKNGGS